MTVVCWHDAVTGRRCTCRCRRGLLQQHGISVQLLHGRVQTLVAGAFADRVFRGGRFWPATFPSANKLPLLKAAACNIINDNYNNNSYYTTIYNIHNLFTLCTMKMKWLIKTNAYICCIVSQSTYCRRSFAEATTAAAVAEVVAGVCSSMYTCASPAGGVDTCCTADCELFVDSVSASWCSDSRLCFCNVALYLSNLQCYS